MLSTLIPLLAPLLMGYLLGSIPFGLLLTRAAGLGDIRKVGSGNIGATNVLRAGGKRLAAATLLLDAAKGAIAVLLARYGEPGAALAAGAGAVLGHMFPVWLGFKGGKGGATVLGVFLALSWQVVAVGAALYLLIAAIFRYSSLASLVAAFFAPAYYLLGGQIAWPFHRLVMVSVLAMSALLVWRHRENIRRLIAGKESKLGSKKKA